MRLEAKIKEIRKEISQLIELKKGVKLKHKILLLKKYKDVSEIQGVLPIAVQ